MALEFTINGIIHVEYLNKYISYIEEISHQYKISDQMKQYVIVNENKELMKHANASFFINYCDHITNSKSLLNKVLNYYDELGIQFIDFEQLDEFNQKYGFIDHKKTPLILKFFQAEKQDTLKDLVKNDTFSLLIYNNIIHQEKYINNLKYKEHVVFDYLCKASNERIKIIHNGLKMRIFNLESTLDLIIKYGYDENIDFDKVLSKTVRKFKNPAFVDAVIYVIEKYNQTYNPKKKHIAETLSMEMKTVFSQKTLKDRNIKTIKNFIIDTPFDIKTKLEILRNFINTWSLKSEDLLAYENLEDLSAIYQWSSQYADLNQQTDMVSYVTSLLQKECIFNTFNDKGLDILNYNIANLLHVASLNQNNCLIPIHLLQLSKCGKIVDFFSLISEESSIKLIKLISNSQYKDEFNATLDPELYLAFLFVQSLKDINMIPKTEMIENLLHFYSSCDPSIYDKYNDMLSKYTNIKDAFINTFSVEYNIYQSILSLKDGVNIKTFYDELKRNNYSLTNIDCALNPT
jgi:hypothetical protein